ncbi:unnamed protein product [Alternaria alternata]
MSHLKETQTTDDTSQEDSCVQFASGKKVIILSNDPPSKKPEEGYILVSDPMATAVDNLGVPGLLIHYASILAIENKVDFHTCPQWDALVEGLDTLRICSKLFSDATIDDLPKVFGYVNYKLPPQHQVTLFIVLSAIFKTTDWMLFERRIVEKEEFEISAVVWVFKIGPRGLTLGRSKRKELETLLEAEEAWIAANRNAVDYEESKKALLQLAAGFVEWGTNAAGLFSAK